MGKRPHFTARAFMRRCGRKTGHPTRGAAEQALREMRRDGAKTSKLRIYECPYCDLFHFGHPAKRDQRRERRAS